MNAATFHCLQQGQQPPGANAGGHGYYDGNVDDDDDESGSEDDVIDVLSADHCTGEHSYTMQMPASMRLEEERRASESPELEAARRLVDWLGSPACRKYSAPFLEPMEAEQRAAYSRVVRQPMCLSRVRASLDARAYSGITEVVRDLRLILENCYRFFGPQHHLTKKALKLETVLEQKLALLPRELREKTTLEATTLENRDLGAQRAGRRARLTSQLPTGGESSALLQLVKAEKAAQAREERLKLREERRVEKEVAQQAAIDWEQATFGPGLARLAQRWEVPQVSQFLRLSQEPLQLPEASTAELERSLLMPEKSSLLALLMTCLLVAPQQRPRSLLQHPMPYRVWNDRLRNRLQNWYRTFLGSQHSFHKVFEAHGLEEQFFAVMGDTDPMESKDFHELDLVQRLWLLKGLCDHKMGQHRRVQEWMAEQEADTLREACLGEDRLGRRYLHFPCLAEPRLYRTAPLPPPPPPSPPPPPPPEEKEKAPATKATRNKSKKKGRPVRSSSRKSSRHHRKAKPPVEEEEQEEVKVKEEPVDPPQEEEEGAAAAEATAAAAPVEEEEKPEFETVATSVAGLRALIASLEEEGADRKPGKPGVAEEQQLLEQLRALLVEWEPQEGRFQQADAALRTRLHREWHQPDTHDTNDAEDALDSWTMHYKDEIDDEQSSSDESQEEEEEEVGEVEDKDNAEDMQEDGRDSEGWRVLRKRKIALPNGLTDCAEDDGMPAKDAATSQSQPCSQSSVPAASFGQPATWATAKRPEPHVPRELAGRPGVPHILARSAAATLPTLATPNATSRSKSSAGTAAPLPTVAMPNTAAWNKPSASPAATLPTVAAPSAKACYQPFASRAATPPTVAAPSTAVWSQPFAKMKTYADYSRRSPKVRSLLEAGITTFPDRQHESSPKPVVLPAALLPPVASPIVQEPEIVPQAETRRQEEAPQELPGLPAASGDELPGVPSLPVASNDALQAAAPSSLPVAGEDGAAVAVANDAVMEDICEQQPAQKSVLVPAVDNSGQEILLHVEYTSVDEASLGNNLQSLALPTVPPMVQNFPTVTTSSMQSVPSALPPPMQSFPVAPPSLAQSVVTTAVQDLAVAQSVAQSIPAAPSSTELHELPATSSGMHPGVVHTNRRLTAAARRVPPWWRHSNTPAATRVKEVPPLAPITTPHKIFKSRNTASMAKQFCPGVESSPDTVADGVHVAATTSSDVLVSSQQQFVGSNGSQQLVFMMPPSSPKPQMVLQQPEAQVMSQELLNQLLPMAAPADDPQTAMLLQTTAMQNAMQTTPLLLLTSDGRLLQVVQQPS